MEENKKDGLKEIRGEFRKIVWPNGHDLYKQTVTVVITSLLFGAIIFVLNLIYGYLFTFLH
ncbi:MAG: preprotein translocase subunit SecE [Lachnospirales bacterium]